MFKRKFSHFIIVSLVMHLMLALSFFIFTQAQKPVEKPVEIVLLDKPSQPASQLKEMDPKQQKKPISQQRNQIVETDENFANNQKNENARFLSAKNNTVEKETRAKTGEQFKNALKNGAKTISAEKQNEKMEKKSALTKTAPDLFAEDFDPYARLQKKQDLLEEKNIAKTADSGAEKGEQSTTNDHLENVGEDLATKLNTKEFKYYGYYQRIKGQLNQWWGPKVRERVVRMFKKGRMLASEGNKTTKLVIILNDVGTLVRVQVLGESGIRDLDEAAIDAFRAAAPFPNPPKGIIDADGTVKIRWDFVIEL